MKLQDGTLVTEGQIEEINAFGPYSMAVWQSGDVSIGNEEGLVGRSQYFVRLIRESILKEFSLDEISQSSILDIGCNDGWVLHELSDLPFAKMVGIEPREKNIEKGQKVRQLLKIDSSVEFRVGDIESLGDEKFDIVICAGVLYHVESISFALRNIRRACNRMVFIESRCISSSHITPELEEEIEMRDLVYQFKDKICGITAQKFESAYHDTSAAYTTIVNVPSTESIIMHLSALGFENISVVAAPDKYRKDVWQNKRPLGGVCLTAILPDSSESLDSEEDTWIRNYEIGLRKEILPRDYLEPLYKVFCLNQPKSVISENLQGIYVFLKDISYEPSDIMDLLPKNNKSKYCLEIIRNWRYNPTDKIRLEYGKLLEFEDQLDEAIKVLKCITTKLNADWRSVYRSFYLMSKIYFQQNNKTEYRKYSNLCYNCNSKYPNEIDRY